MSYNGVLDRYRQYLPVTDRTPGLTLLEGNTPLIPASVISGDINLYLKFEGQNPTGSFKDRGMVVAVAKAKEEGSDTIICASTGNTSASAAAYAARAGMQCVVVVPDGKIAGGKLAQAVVHGARVLQLAGNFDQALKLVVELAREMGMALVNSVNPYRLQGQKTAAFEIVDVLGDAPSFHILPVGNAGNITAYWMGYKEYRQAGHSTRLPKIIGIQAAGAAPLIIGKPVERPETRATAIRIGNPASWQGAVAAKDESGGGFFTVTDEEILSAQRLLASKEGVFAEPASCASVAGFLKLARMGFFPKGSDVVCVLTGHGLKDTDTVLSLPFETYRVSADIEEIRKMLGVGR